MGPHTLARPRCVFLGVAFAATPVDEKTVSASLIVGGLVAFVKAIPIIDGWFRLAMAAWMNGQTNETLTNIADAAALAARAKTDEDRYAAAAKWQAALSQPRQTP